MHVLVIGAAGMIGRKLTQRLASDGRLGERRVTQATLYDVVPAPVPAGASFPIGVEVGDLPAPGETDRLMAGRPEVVFNLAAIVSGEAEEDFDKGYRINLDGMRNLLDSIQAAGHAPRLVFASSLAVFGAPFPAAIPDDYHLTPLTSYGTQKAIGELLLADYTRKSFVDGVGLRLPTICVRPGNPNKAASGFFSSILREPLAGQEAVLPVGDDVRHWFASPRAAVGFLVHAASLDARILGPRRSITMPGVTATIGEMIAALRKVAGDEVAARIRRVRDPFIEEIVAGWPRKFTTQRALELGFTAERSVEDIIRIHIDDELDGQIA